MSAGRLVVVEQREGTVEAVLWALSSLKAEGEGGLLELVQPAPSLSLECRGGLVVEVVLMLEIVALLVTAPMVCQAEMEVMALSLIWVL